MVRCVGMFSIFDFFKIFFWFFFGFEDVFRHRWCYFLNSWYGAWFNWNYFGIDLMSMGATVSRLRFISHRDGGQVPSHETGGKVVDVVALHGHRGPFQQHRGVVSGVVALDDRVRTAQAAHEHGQVLLHDFLRHKLKKISKNSKNSKKIQKNLIKIIKKSYQKKKQTGTRKHRYMGKSSLKNISSQKNDQIGICKNTRRNLWCWAFFCGQTTSEQTATFSNSNFSTNQIFAWNQSHRLPIQCQYKTNFGRGGGGEREEILRGGHRSTAGDKTWQLQAAPRVRD